MKVAIKEGVCVGHAMCVLACPDMFVLERDDGHATVVSEEVPPALEAGVEHAFNSCPEGAIVIY